MIVNLNISSNPETDPKISKRASTYFNMSSIGGLEVAGRSKSLLHLDATNVIFDTNILDNKGQHTGPI